MTKSRNINTLIAQWQAICNDDQLVEFIDGMSMRETRVLEKAIAQGQCPKEPSYITEAAE